MIETYSGQLITIDEPRAKMPHPRAQCQHGATYQHGHADQLATPRTARPLPAITGMGRP